MTLGRITGSLYRTCLLLSVTQALSWCRNATSIWCQAQIKSVADVIHYWSTPSTRVARAFSLARMTRALDGRLAAKCGSQLKWLIQCLCRRSRRLACSQETRRWLSLAEKQTSLSDLTQEISIIAQSRPMSPLPLVSWLSGHASHSEVTSSVASSVTSATWLTQARCSCMCMRKRSNHGSTHRSASSILNETADMGLTRRQIKSSLRNESSAKR